MKKMFSVLIVFTIVISMLCTTTLSVFASFSDTRGLGIVDNTDYYIYVGEGTLFRNKHFMRPQQGMPGQNVITSSDVQTFDNSYIWNIDKQSDGTFRIINLATPGYYLSTNVNIGNGANVITDSTEHDDYINFEIYRIDDDIYEDYFLQNANQALKGKYLIKSDIYYLTMGTSGVILTTTPTEFSCWSFMEADKGRAEYYGYEFDDVDTTNYETLVYNAYNGMGYYPETHDNYRNTYWICEYMKSNDITIIASDGEAGAAIIDPDSTISCGKISADYQIPDDNIQTYISDLPANCFANSRCIIYLSSNSGTDATGEDGEPYNLVEETYKKGAHYVLGFTSSLQQEEIELWIENFISEVNNGATINTAVALANFRAVASTYALGDGTQHLKFPTPQN